jgi:hypothetical protein
VIRDADIVLEDDPADALRALQEAILLHPAAAQALFFALVQEGRRYAETDEGSALRERLRRSELIANARSMFDAVTVRALEDNPDTVIPSAILEALVKAASDAGRERLLESLFVGLEPPGKV